MPDARKQAVVDAAAALHDLVHKGVFRVCMEPECREMRRAIEDWTR